MSKTIQSHTLILAKEEQDDLLQQRFMNPESKYEKESIIDCPDRSDTIIKCIIQKTEPYTTVKTVIIYRWNRRRSASI